MADYTYQSALAHYMQGLLYDKHALGFLYNEEVKFVSRFDQYWIVN